MRILFINMVHPLLWDGLLEKGITCIDGSTWDLSKIHAEIHAFEGIVLKSRIRIDSVLLTKATKLKFVARAGVGIEHIDEVACRQMGVQVITSPEGSMVTVAEHTIGLMLSMMNHLARADRQIRAGQWIREGNRGVELFGKTVGILGYGNMGQQVARRLSSFGVKVLAYDKYKTVYGDEYAEAVPLKVLQSKSDVLSIHIPFEEDNRYFIDEAFLAAFAKPIFVINTARGIVLDTKALLQALDTGKVLGAALDVIEYEEQSFDDFSFDALPEDFQKLLANDNVILSPHIAGWSFESHEGHSRVLLGKILGIKLNVDVL